jgi:hypothetical protein
VVLLTLLAACSSHAHALSKSEYVKQADAICTEMGGHLTKGSSKATGTTVVVANVNQVWTAELAKLRALKAPKADRATVAKLWNEEEAAFTRWTAELETGNLVKTFNDEPAIFHQVAVDTEAYGIKNCGT